jgi:Fe-S oxidoreductase
MELDFRFFYTLTLMLLSGVSAGIAFRRLYRLIRLGKNENLFSEIPKRIGIFSQVVLGQSKLFKDFGPGLQHAIIFWGFIIITIGTLEMIIEGFVHDFTFAFLGPFYDYTVFIQDFLHPLVLAAVLYGLGRRLVFQPKRLPAEWAKKKEAVFVLILTGTLMFANVMSFGGFVLGEHVLGHAHWRPFSRMIADMLAAFGMTSEQGISLGYFFWGVHLLTVFSFGAYIPRSKHLHIIAAGPNVFFTRTKHRGTFAPINFADETQTVYGVSKITQFTWKDILDTYSCTQCGRCNEYCPTATTGKPLKPMYLIEDIKHHLFDVGDKLIADSNAETEAMVSEKTGLSEETIWACTTCRACVEACPVMIEHVDKIVDLRRNLVLMEGKMPAELQVTMKNWETQSNPWGMSPDVRDEWAKGLDIPRLSEKPDAEYLFYVGCAGSFNDRNKKISTSFVKILKKAGIDFAILGKEELCNGETARRAGNEYLAKTMIDANIAVLQKYNVKKVLTTCPHCFNTLKNEYPDFGFKASEVLHHTDFIDRLIKENKIVALEGSGKDKIKVAFHDSCYLGRYNDIYEEPRSALRAFGGDVIELPRNKQKGLCCGAGGARMWMEETIGKRINVERVEEALETKPDVIAAGCPFCQVMLSDGVTEKESKVPVVDIAEFVADRL